MGSFYEIALAVDELPLCLHEYHILSTEYRHRLLFSWSMQYQIMYQNDILYPIHIQIGMTYVLKYNAAFHIRNPIL